jgi:hypothetical protein
MRLNRYLTEAARPGVQMEHAIVSVWNGGEIPPVAVDPRITKEGIDIIVNSLRGKAKGKASVLGASTIEVSPNWAKYFPGGKVPGSTKTPKTDIVIGGSKISLKSGKSAMLMSAAKGESLATFYNVADKLSLNDTVKRITAKLEKIMTHGITSEPDIETAILSDKLIQASDKAHKEATVMLTKFFNSDIHFKTEFAREAMSGEIKFNNGIGAAEYMLAVEFDGSKVNWHSINDGSYVSGIAKQMGINVAFKSAGITRRGEKTGERRWWSAVRLIGKKLTEELEQYKGQEMNEGLIAKIYDKIKKWVSGLVSRITKYISESWSNLLDFMGLDPIIKVKTVVKF